MGVVAQDFNSSTREAKESISMAGRMGRWDSWKETDLWKGADI